jgi:hypothetical protein
MLRQRQRLKASPSQQKNAGAMLGLFLGSQMVQMLAPTWFGDELAWQFKVTIQFLLLFFCFGDRFKFLFGGLKLPGLMISHSLAVCDP